MKIYENIVIGGGASALMFVASLSNKKETIIIEGNAHLGAKILISGGGKCNFTNKSVTFKDYLGEKEFIEAIVKKYNNRWLLHWFTSRGLAYTIKNNREYFCKNSAKELVNILLREIKGVKQEFNCKVKNLVKDGDIFKVVCDSKVFFSKRVIVASGGLSFPKLGATGIGYEIAEAFGHRVETTQPALVGFTLQPKDTFMKELSGVSVDVSLKVANRKFDGSLLFTHRGLSGPVILNASLFWQKGHIEIDFLPDFDLNRIKTSAKSLSNILPLPKRVTKEFLSTFAIKDRAAKLLSSEEWQKVKTLKCYTFAPAGTFGFSKAEVTKGGVNVTEIDQISLMSKKVENLFFLGEVLDITGRLGGYNFQWAFASAAKCADWIEGID